MNKCEFPLSPTLLALIPGPMREQNFARFVDLNRGSFWEILRHPIAIGLFVVSVGAIIFSIFNRRKINGPESQGMARKD